MANKYLDLTGVQYLWGKIKAEDDRTLLAANKYVNDLWGLTDDENAVVDKIKEVLKVFENYNEGKNLLDFINSKLDKTGGVIEGDLEIKNGSLTLPESNSVTVGETKYLSDHIEYKGYSLDFPETDGTIATLDDISTDPEFNSVTVGETKYLSDHIEYKGYSLDFPETDGTLATLDDIPINVALTKNEIDAVTA